MFKNGLVVELSMVSGVYVLDEKDKFCSDFRRKFLIASETNKNYEFVDQMEALIDVYYNRGTMIIVSNRGFCMVGNDKKRFGVIRNYIKRKTNANFTIMNSK